MWIGDFVRCHTVVKLLKARFPARPVDVLRPTLCAPLADYMPELRQAIVVDLPRKRLALGQHAALADRLRRESYGTALIMPRTWKAALAPFLAGIPERVGWRRRNALRASQRPALGRAQAPAHGRPVRRPGAAARRAATAANGRCRSSSVPSAEVTGWRERLGSPRAASGGACARCRRAVEALAGARLSRRSRAPDSRKAAPSGSSAGRTRTPLAAQIIAMHAPARPRSHRHRPARRDPGACGSRRRGLERLRACCTSRPRSARRPSASSARPARGTGRRSIRSPPPCRSRRSSTASPATSRPAACVIIAACAIFRPSRCWRWRSARSRRRPADLGPRSARRRRSTSSTDGICAERADHSRSSPPRADRAAPARCRQRSPTSGTPSAAARCNSPVSTPTTKAARAIIRATGVERLQVGHFRARHRRGDLDAAPPLGLGAPGQHHRIAARPERLRRARSSARPAIPSRAARSRAAGPRRARPARRISAARSSPKSSGPSGA